MTCGYCHAELETFDDPVSGRMIWVHHTTQDFIDCCTNGQWGGQTSLFGQAAPRPRRRSRRRS